MEKNNHSFSFKNNKNPYEKYLLNKWIRVEYRNDYVSGKLINIDLKFGKGILYPYSGLEFEDKSRLKLIKKYCLFDLDNLLSIQITTRKSLENYCKKANERIDEMERKEKEKELKMEIKNENQ